MYGKSLVMGDRSEVGTGLREDVVDERACHITHQTAGSAVLGGELAVRRVDDGVHSGEHVSDGGEELLGDNGPVAGPRVAESDDHRDDLRNQNLQVAHDYVAQQDTQQESRHVLKALFV